MEAINLQYIEGDPIEGLQKTIVDKKIDAVICGGLTTQYNIIKEIFDAARLANPSIITIGGGGGFSSEPILFSEMLEVDYAVIGEGEITNCELAYALDHKESVEHIQGLVYKKGNSYIYTGERPYIRDLDSIPFPSYEGLAMDKYLDQQKVDGWYHTHAAFSDDPRIIPMCLARSCPFNCKFCYHPIGRGYRSRSLDNFFEELDIWIEKYKINAIALIDECFSIVPDRVVEFCKRIKPYNIAWACQMRVETYSEELIKIMVDAGCVSACFGVESMSQEVLNDMNKKTNIQQLQNALETSYKFGGGAAGNLIFGAAAETAETIRKTMEWRKNNKKYTINNFTMIGTYPGSGYYEDALKRGVIADKKQFIEQGCPFVNITGMSEKQYRVLEAYVHLKDMEVQNRGKIIRVEETEDGINAVLECKHCGYQNYYKGIQKDKVIHGELRLKTMVCRNCHNYNDYVSEPSDYKESWNTANWLYDWLVGNHNTKLEDYINMHDFHKIAIYGVGLAAEGLSNFFVEELGKTQAEIAYAIDRRFDLFQDRVFPVLGIDDVFPEADAIIVIPIYYFSQISAALKEKTSIPIVSLEEVLA